VRKQVRLEKPSGRICLSGNDCLASKEWSCYVSTDDTGEDQACAGYIAALLCERTPETAAMLGRIREPALEASRTNISKGTWTQAQGAALEADLASCLSLEMKPVIKPVNGCSRA
jgi:hypothetical protein